MIDKFVNSAYICVEFDNGDLNDKQIEHIKDMMENVSNKSNNRCHDTVDINGIVYLSYNCHVDNSSLGQVEGTVIDILKHYGNLIGALDASINYTDSIVRKHEKTVRFNFNRFNNSVEKIIEEKHLIDI